MKRVSEIGVLVVCALTLVTVADAQTRKQTSRKTPLKQTGLPVQSGAPSDAQLSNELRKLLLPAGINVGAEAFAEHKGKSQTLLLRWQPNAPSVSSSSGATPLETSTRADAVAVVEKSTNEREATFPRLRSVELGASQIFVAAIDADKNLRWWTIVHDPRITRFETPDATGLLSGEILTNDAAELFLTFPADDEIADVRLFKPQWNGKVFTLVDAGRLALASGK